MGEPRHLAALGIAIFLGALTLPAARGQPVASAGEQSRSAPELADGPYVEQVGARRWRAKLVGADGAVTEVSAVKGRIEVPAIAGTPAFTVLLRRRPPPARSAERLEKCAPLLVVADTHGEYPILVAFLQAQGVIGADLAWEFGSGRLVVTGDMLDRGAHQLEILWLLYKLEGEATKMGGRVHVLVGNHEAMLLRGDQRYLNPRYTEVAKRLGAPAYSALLGPETVLGAWLRSRPAVLRLGDLLLLHGGISPDITSSSLTLDTINGTVRRSLDTPFDTKLAEGSMDALVMGSSGPLWYRGYFELEDKPAAASTADVDASLKRFGVSHILVGHTIVDHVIPLYGGKVIAVQIYPHQDEKTGAPILEGALRLQGEWYRATAQGERVALFPPD